MAHVKRSFVSYRSPALQTSWEYFDESVFLPFYLFSWNHPTKTFLPSPIKFGCSLGLPPSSDLGLLLLPAGDFCSPSALPWIFASSILCLSGFVSTFWVEGMCSSKFSRKLQEGFLLRASAAPHTPDLWCDRVWLSRLEITGGVSRETASRPKPF